MSTNAATVGLLQVAAHSFVASLTKWKHDRITLEIKMLMLSRSSHVCFNAALSFCLPVVNSNVRMREHDATSEIEDSVHQGKTKIPLRRDWSRRPVYFSVV